MTPGKLPPSQQDLDAIRERHPEGQEHICGARRFDDKRPCDTRVVLDALDARGVELDKRTVERDGMEMVASQLQSERDAARADADRLAEAAMAAADEWEQATTDMLVWFAKGGDGFHEFPREAYNALREALRLHEEATR